MPFCAGLTQGQDEPKPKPIKTQKNYFVKIDFPPKWELVGRAGALASAWGEILRLDNYYLIS